MSKHDHETNASGVNTPANCPTMLREEQGRRRIGKDAAAESRRQRKAGTERRGTQRRQGLLPGPIPGGGERVSDFEAGVAKGFVTTDRARVGTSTESFAKGRQDRSLAIRGVLARREQAWLRTLEQLGEQEAWCKAHPGNRLLEQSLNAGQRHAMTCLGELQAVIEAVKAIG